MLVSQEVPVKWNSKNKKKYEDLGYQYTRMGDEFTIKVCDLSKGSRVRVVVKCDYCGREFTKSYDWYNKARSVVQKDCCNNPECTTAKAEDGLLARYGVKNARAIDGVNDKIKATCVERYGVENPFAAKEIIEKICATNMERRGVPWSTMSPDVIEKQKKTCVEKYGVPCYLNLDFAGDNNRGEKNPRWRGGIVRGERNGYHASDYIMWRNAVFAKDKYTCQACGAHTGHGHAVKLNAHHIYNWASYPEYRFETNNGIALCEQCHSLFHSIYGKKNNTPEQLEEFIASRKKDMLTSCETRSMRTAG